jgi:uncharacterized protein
MNRAIHWLACLVAVLACFSPGAAFAFTVPPLQGAVTDTAGKLTAADDTYLEERIRQYRARSGNELGVLVTGSLEGESIEDVAYQTFNTWGVGKKGVDNGALLVIAPNERRTRIETGRGIEHRVTDLAAARILAEQLAPRLRDDRFRDGIDAALVALEAELDGMTSAAGAAPGALAAPASTSAPVTTSTPPAQVKVKTSSDDWTPTAIILLAGVGFLVLLLWLFRARRHRPHHGGSDHSTWASHDTSSFSSHSTFSGGGDFGGGGSGGGDFGGGSSGGGGASGDY